MTKCSTDAAGFHFFPPAHPCTHTPLHAHMLAHDGTRQDFLGRPGDICISPVFCQFQRQWMPTIVFFPLADWLREGSVAWSQAVPVVRSRDPGPQGFPP